VLRIFDNSTEVLKESPKSNRSRKNRLNGAARGPDRIRCGPNWRLCPRRSSVAVGDLQQRSNEAAVNESLDETRRQRRHRRVFPLQLRRRPVVLYAGDDNAPRMHSREAHSGQDLWYSRRLEEQEAESL
jgi:hypothetical protein